MKTKFIFTLGIFFGAIISSFSQDQVKEFEILNSQKVKNYGFSKNGNFFVNKKNKAISGKSKDFTLLVFDNKSIENVYDFSPKKNFRVYNISPDGKNILYDYSKGFSLKSKYGILDKEGGIKLIKELKLKGDLYEDPKFITLDFMTNNNYYAIGKKKKEDTKNYVLTRSLVSPNAQYSEFNLPPIKTKREFLRWKDNKILDDKFILLAKDYVDSRHDKYHIALLNEKTTDVELVTLNVDLEKYYLCMSYNGGGFWFIDSYTNSKGEIRQIIAPTAGTVGNLYVDEKNNAFYTYGVFSKKDRVRKFNSPMGFYVYKFDWKGNLIWKIVNEVKSKGFNKTQSGYAFKVKFNKITDQSIGLSINPGEDNNIYLYDISSDTGKIARTKKIELKHYNFGGFGNTDNIYSNEFISDYVLKDEYSKRLMLDANTIMGAFFNKDLEKYLKSKFNNKRKLNFISNITDSGITVLQANNKDNKFYLLKFNR